MIFKINMMYINYAPMENIINAPIENNISY